MYIIIYYLQNILVIIATNTNVAIYAINTVKPMPSFSLCPISQIEAI
nr:MAG TPA: hypothetical protein [Caudoviricetes sp.]